MLFVKSKKWLINRANWVKTGLENIWIRAEALNKSELIKFLTDYYNPSLNNLVTVKDLTENYNVIQ